MAVVVAGLAEAVAGMRPRQNLYHRSGPLARVTTLHAVSPTLGPQMRGKPMCDLDRDLAGL